MVSGTGEYIKSEDQFVAAGIRRLLRKTQDVTHGYRVSFGGVKHVLKLDTGDGSEILQIHEIPGKCTYSIGEFLQFDNYVSVNKVSLIAGDGRCRLRKRGKPKKVILCLF